RDFHVTGVQTCALPISGDRNDRLRLVGRGSPHGCRRVFCARGRCAGTCGSVIGGTCICNFAQEDPFRPCRIILYARCGEATLSRSEERRGGKEWILLLT